MTAGRVTGAVPDEGGTTFSAWAPCAEHVDVRLFADAGRAVETLPLRAVGNGWHDARLAHVGPGALYKFVLDGRELPDPYARFLPFGVHGPAEVVRRTRARAASTRAALERCVLYELHVGTFTPEGTYAGAADRLADLAALGVTAVELMPLSAFPGARGWGYDGVAHFAPFAPYGRPEALRAFVARAHALGMILLLDVVYNHFGPRGNYLGAYSKDYFLPIEAGPWGGVPNFGLPMMRRYVLDNARMWLDEYGFDGLRLDATHAIRDYSTKHILRELRETAPGKILVAEDERNDPALVADFGLDAVWADDFHHQLRVILTGERDGYYGAYDPALERLARVIERGWLYEGQTYEPWGRSRGKSATRLSPRSFVYCVENHDQVGNRALGTRLDRDASVEALRAATVLLLFLPMTPLLFMGQEWAASSPFLFFTDHDEEFGPLVSKGRREEFKRFRAFSDPATLARIPDPQAVQTFEASKLRWEEREREPHRATLEAVRAMLRLRREHPVLRAPARRSDVRAAARGNLLFVERRGDDRALYLIANLSANPAEVHLAAPPLLTVGEYGAGMLAAHSVLVCARLGHPWPEDDRPRLAPA